MCACDIPHEEEGPGDKSRILVEETNRSKLRFPVTTSSQTGNNISRRANTGKPDRVKTEEMNLTLQNRSHQLVRMRLRGKAEEVPSSSPESSQAVKRVEVAFPKRDFHLLRRPQ